MDEIEPMAALLAGRLARAVGSGATVCLGCPLAGVAPPTPLLTLCEAPFDALPLRTERQFLVVFRSDPAAQLAAGNCAQAKVPEVWLLSRGQEWLESLTCPRGGRYRRRRIVLPAESMALAALPAVRFVPLEAN